MNTDSIPIVNLIPEKYRGWFLLAVAIFPYATRAFYAVISGGGIVGIFHSVFFGTNIPPKLQNDIRGNSIVPGATSILLALALPVLFFTGCAAIQTGQRAVVVRAEQSITVANATFDAAVHIDAANREFFKTNAPAFHNFCDWLRTPVLIAPLTNSLPRGLAICESAATVKNIFKASKATNDLSALVSSLAALESATAQAQQFLAAQNTK